MSKKPEKKAKRKVGKRGNFYPQFVSTLGISCWIHFT